MQSEIVIFLLITTSFALSLFLAWFTFSQRENKLSVPFSVFMLGTSLWCLFYIFELFSQDPASILLYNKLKQIGFQLVAVSWLVISMIATNRYKWYTARNISILSVVPTLSLIAIFTNDLHYLYWNDFNLVEQNTFLLARLSYGPVYWLNIAFTYLYFALGIIFFLQDLPKNTLYHRQSIVTLIIATTITWISHILNTINSPYLIPYDYVPLTSIITVVLIIIAIFKYDLFSLQAIISRNLFKNLPNPVLYLSREQQIVDYNKAFAEEFDQGNAEQIKSLNTKIRNWLQESLSQNYTEGTFTPEIEENPSHYKVIRKPITAFNEEGQLLSFTNITSTLNKLHVLEQSVNSLTSINQQYKHLTQWALRLNEWHSFNEMFDQFAKTVAPMLGFYHVGYYFLDNASRFAQLYRANTEGGKQLIKLGYKVSIEQTNLIGKAVLSRSIQSSSNDLINKEITETLPLSRYFVAIPIFKDQEVFGILELHSSNIELSKKIDVPLLDTIRQIFTSGIVYLQSDKQGEKTHTVKPSINLTTVLQQAKAYQYTPLEVIQVSPKEILPPQKPQIISDEHSYKLQLPLRMRNLTLGTIILSRSKNQAPWSEDDINVAEAALTQVSLALETALLVEDTKNRAELERRASEIISRFSSSINMESIMQNALSDIGKLPGVTEVSVHLAPPEVEG